MGIKQEILLVRHYIAMMDNHMAKQWTMNWEPGIVWGL